MTTVRTRFAPSPTGFLHIGGVRTALFCWLYARRHGGQFLLRIEDTDLERSEDRFTQDILACMKWLGLSWDEEVIYQSKRLELYRAQAEELIGRGLAYRCTCTEADVEKMREAAMAAGKKPMYDRRCRELKRPAGSEPFVIRLKVPLDGHVEWDDLIRGVIRIENAEVDDFVLIRSNGAPTYNLSVVVDDHACRMTHVLRGEEHTTNTPKQIHLYRAFGAEPPRFGHMPVILAADKKKLSKRHGAVAVSQYRADGYLPEALLNFLARLGWSHGDQEVFSMEELVRFFSFDNVQKAGAVFNTEKLLWLNGTHIRSAKPERLRDIVVSEHAEALGARALPRVKTEIGPRLVALIQPKVKLLRELPEQLAPLCEPGVPQVDASGLKWNADPTLKASTKAALKDALEQLRAKGAALPARNSAEWGNAAALADAGLTPQDVDAVFRQAGERHGVKLGDLVQPARLLVTGRMVSASLFDLVAVLPWNVVEERLAAALALP
jgi:glutamyl-tRNA synthetase